MTFDLVLARFKEDVSWTRHVSEPWRVLVYSMSGDPVSLERGTVIEIDNSGQEPNSYLTHILLNYDRLADVTVFSQAQPAPHMPGGCQQAFYDALQKVLDDPPKDYRPVSMVCQSGREDHLARRVWLHHKPNPRMKYGKMPLEDACQELFGKPCPEHLEHAFGAIFAVTKDAVRCRSWEWYGKMQRWACHSEKTVEAACLEKLWQLVMGGY